MRCVNPRNDKSITWSIISQREETERKYDTWPYNCNKTTSLPQPVLLRVVHISPSMSKTKKKIALKKKECFRGKKN